MNEERGSRTRLGQGGLVLSLSIRNVFASTADSDVFFNANTIPFFIFGNVTQFPLEGEISFLPVKFSILILRSFIFLDKRWYQVICETLAVRAVEINRLSGELMAANLCARGGMKYPQSVHRSLLVF